MLRVGERVITEFTGYRDIGYEKEEKKGNTISLK